MPSGIHGTVKKILTENILTTFNLDNLLLSKYQWTLMVLSCSFKFCYAILFTPQCWGIVFTLCLDGWAFGQAGGGQKFVRAVSQNL